VKTPWAEPNSRFTMAMECRIIDAISACETVQGACQLARVSWDEARGIMERAVMRGTARKKPADIRNLWVDEKAILKGHRYVTLAYDLDRGVVDEGTKDRKQASLERYLSAKTPQQLAAIEAICMDMWEPYRLAVLSAVPAGDSKIVHDKHHIISHMNKALNDVRAAEARSLKANEDDRLTGTRQMWLWVDENRPDRYAHRFAALMKSDLATAKVWALKENLRRLWNHRSSRTARQHFAHWYRRAIALGQDAVTKVANMIRERLRNVVGYCDHLCPPWNSCR
jgi:transposase